MTIRELLEDVELLEGKALYIPYDQKGAYLEAWKTVTDYPARVRDGFPRNFSDPTKEYKRFEQVSLELESIPCEEVLPYDGGTYPTGFLSDSLNPLPNLSEVGGIFYVVRPDIEILKELHISVGDRVRYDGPLVNKKKDPGEFTLLPPTKPVEYTDIFGVVENVSEIGEWEQAMVAWETKREKHLRKKKLWLEHQCMCEKYVVLSKVSFEGEVFGEYHILRETFMKCFRKYLFHFQLKYHETPIHFVVPYQEKVDFRDGKLYLNGKELWLRAPVIYLSFI